MSFGFFPVMKFWFDHFFLREVMLMRTGSDTVPAIADVGMRTASHAVVGPSRLPRMVALV